MLIPLILSGRLGFWENSNRNLSFCSKEVDKYFWIPKSVKKIWLEIKVKSSKDSWPVKLVETQTLWSCYFDLKIGKKVLELGSETGNYLENMFETNKTYFVRVLY